MTEKAKVIVPLIQNISGPEVRVGEAPVLEDRIVWIFQGDYGKGLLEIVREDLIKVANSGGAQIFDLMAPFEPYTD